MSGKRVRDVRCAGGGLICLSYLYLNVWVLCRKRFKLWVLGKGRREGALYLQSLLNSTLGLVRIGLVSVEVAVR